MTQYYVGTKIITAWPATNSEGQEGYSVKYDNGYTSWSPKDVFEKAYLPMGESNNNTVTQAMVDDFIVATDTKKMGEKTTVVQATLRNGFNLTETSSCVDPANYDEAMGHKLCMEAIAKKVWHLLGFLVQTGFEGVAASTE